MQLSRLEAAGVLSPAAAAELRARGVRGAADLALLDVGGGVAGGVGGGGGVGAPLPASALGAALAALRATGDAPAPPVPAGAARARPARAPTGCGPLDALLGGGLRPGALTELCGTSALGKTQLATLCAAAAAARGGSVVFVDASNAFSAARLADLLDGIARRPGAAHAGAPAQPRGAEGRAKARALRSVAVYRVHSAHEAVALLDECLVETANAHSLNAAAELAEQQGRGGLQAPTARPQQDGVAAFFARLELVVVDSAGALLSPVLGAGQGQGHALMAQLEAAMKRLAGSRGGNKVCVLCTNHVVGGADKGGHAVAAPQPALGLSWRRAPAVRVLLERDERREGATRCSLEEPLVDTDRAPAQVTLRVGREIIA